MLYMWRHDETGDQVVVVRAVSDIDVPPTDAELHDAGFGPDPEWWTRVIAPSNLPVIKTNAWGYGKGFWGSKTPGRGKQ